MGAPGGGPCAGAPRIPGPRRGGVGHCHVGGLFLCLIGRGIPRIAGERVGLRHPVPLAPQKAPEEDSPVRVTDARLDQGLAALIGVQGDGGLRQGSY